MTTTTTRHAARCQTPGCNRFVPVGDVHCGACVNASRTAWNALENERKGHATEVHVLEEAVKTACNAAVADHAAHIEAMEEQERNADAVISELRTVIAELREQNTTLTTERDDAMRCCKAVKQSAHDNARNFRDSEVLRLEAERRAEAAQAETALAITQRDRAVADAERLARWLGYAIGAAIVGALAAIAGWVR